ncbi:30S ribosomal protein S6 [Acetobacter pasteurianus]|uniref:Small ribosomal subunit protein bS6m n=1 Tax=Lodderomyces elongisporus (strain ATCC 11503 / CBS 2605 / JCM 1781 / NBRC 1676 / NRRL YB-4239) TaxID=379508 RepID=A5E268_LODEL|nr:mitochondrial ribosomal small subunit component [Lodderomyces elongisporus]EDK45526.1 mitochondrial 40S ribosomal protein MRP17 [Lodderomyces elongisporus NRRL YB-4239]MDC6271934.1 30S ribosomal protein S6 [Acetobacter pasteurianus]WLF80746.1 mitochondrial ribosomal small subunit component [Lodderomyces elongisporus]
MHYELFAIARITDPIIHNKEAKKIASTVGKLILNNRGVIRSITSMGVKPLPKIISKDQERHFRGYNFFINFDSSSKVQEQLLRTLMSDPRVLRANIKKIDMSRSLNPGSSVEQAVNAH